MQGCVCAKWKWGSMYMPELGGTVSRLIDVMRTKLVQQVTERRAGTLWLQQTLAAADWNELQILQSYANVLFHTVADTWMDSFQVCWIQKLWPCGKLLAVARELTGSLTVFVVCEWGAVVLKRNGGAAAVKGLFKCQWSTAGKRIIPFILPPFLIWHTFCHSSFSLHLSSSSSFYLFCSLLLYSSVENLMVSWAQSVTFFHSEQ